MRWGPHIAVASGLVAVLIGSGASLDPAHARADRDYRLERARMEAALEAVHTRLESLGRTVGGERDARSAVLVEELAQLEERHSVMMANLDSLGRIGDHGWRGPMIGLRASLADLEHRADLAFLSATDAAGTDSLFDTWLADVAAQLVKVDAAIQDSVTATVWREEIEELRSAQAALAAARLSLEEAEPEAADARTRFANDLVLLRRRVRAFVRSADALNSRTT